MGVAFVYATRLRDIGQPRGLWLQIEQCRMPTFADAQRRGLSASILVFASGCGDIPALLAWRIPGEWILVPVQIGMEILILGVLCAPERWFSR
jgi:hypothetical protein